MLTSSPHLPLLPPRPHSSRVDGLSYDAIAQTLSEFKPIAFNVNFARITGDAKAALMLSQLMYWTKRGISVLECDGWIFKTRDQWITEIGLGRHEQSTARQTLIDLGLIEESRIGHPARNCFRIIPQELGNRLADLLRTETVQWSLLDIRNDAEHVKSILGRTFAFYCVFVDITNSCTNAIYLSKALTIQKRFTKQTDSDNATLSWSREWFRMAASTTHDETGLTVAQQRKAKESLCELGLLHEAMMEFPRKQIYLRIDTSTLQQKLIAALTACKNQPVDKNQVIHTSIKSHAKTSQSDFLTERNRHFGQSVGPRQVGQSVEIKEQIDRNPEIARNSSLSDAKTYPPEGQLTHGSRQVLARRAAGFSMLSRQVLAPLHARDAMRAGVTTNNDYKEEITTTPTSPPFDDVPIAAPNVVVVDFELIWPETLSDWQRGQCRKILTPLAKADQQDLLDELAGHLLGRCINNPVSYLGSLARKHQSTPGGLVFEKADSRTKCNKDELVIGG
ncbi:hypothetical protein [Limnohabitans sp.]|uniref:hypothetical protein n=1 Tax=Limnohabitans sp. TaxID=1907725 RepID=UPI00286F4290|nr:hypothetical protein [Limnohabitans sp.]